MTTADTTTTTATPPDAMPVLPLRDVVVYPHMVIPLFVGRERSILALEQAMKLDKQILLLAQKQADVDDPAPKDLYDVGTIATILQLLKLPDGTVKVLVEGVERARVAQLVAGDYFAAKKSPVTSCSTLARSTPSTSTFTVPSGSLSNCRMVAIVPTS